MSKTIKFKNPDAPATDKQVWLFNKILGEKGYPAEGFAAGVTVKEASEAIDAAKLLPPAVKPAQEAGPSLIEMAAAIGQPKAEVATPTAPNCKYCDDTGVVDIDDDGLDEDGAPIMRTIYCKSTTCPKSKNYVPAEDDLEATPALMQAFNREQCKALRSAVSCLIGESDGTEMDHTLYAILDAFIEGKPAPTEVQLPDYIGGGTVAV